LQLFRFPDPHAIALIQALTVDLEVTADVKNKNSFVDRVKGIREWLARLEAAQGRPGVLVDLTMALALFVVDNGTPDLSILLLQAYII
jgi:hypothetical protein